jgi:hypothetical protein
LLPPSHCLLPCFHCSPTLSFLSWLQQRLSSLDLCPTLTFKFWWVCSSIQVSVHPTLEIQLWITTKLCWGRDSLCPLTEWFHLLFSGDS